MMEPGMDPNKERRALGRGLAALIPGAAATNASTNTQAGLRQVPIERIHPNRSQPRKHFEEERLQELATSIEARGVLQPLVVRRRGEGYELVAGERRWRAAARAGLKEVPVIVKELSDSEAIQVALIENIQRQDLDPLEEAEAFSRLIEEYGLHQEQVADAVGRSRSSVANTLRLLKLPAPIVRMMGDGRLTAGHARALMTLASEEAMSKLAEQIIDRKLSVRDAERQARLLHAKKKCTEKRSTSETNVEERLQRSLGTKVRLRQRRGKGRIEVYFHSLDQLDDLLARMAP